MNETINGKKIKIALLETVNELKDSKSGFQTGAVFQKFEEKVKIERNNDELQHAVLTIFYDLFRVGYLAWGINIGNPNPPFIHITEKGRVILQHLSRDPGNPDGYLHYIKSNARISLITESYLFEALETYNSGLYKASAVMIGCSAENIIIELADKLILKLRILNRPINKSLEEWKIKRVLLGIEEIFEGEKQNIPFDLFESFQANWPAFTQQIRKIRNDAGHPASLTDITEENVHASLLIFPELAKLADQLSQWVDLHLK